MITDNNSVQFSNADALIIRTLLGIIIFLGDPEYLNADVPIFEIVFGIMVYGQPITRVLVLVSISALQLSRES